MNWLFWAVAALILYEMIDGFRKGFIRKSVSAVSMLLTLVLVTWLTPQLTTVIREKTEIQTNLQKTCSEFFMDDDYDPQVKTDQMLMIENMKLPENIREMLIENNNSEAYELLAVTGFYEYVGAYLANMIINALAYLLSFVVVWALLKAVLTALDVVTMLPILHGVNKLAGGVLGVAQGILLVWVLFLLAAILCNGSMGQQFLELINENQFLNYLYERNVIMEIVFGLIF